MDNHKKEHIKGSQQDHYKEVVTGFSRSPRVAAILAPNEPM